MSFLPMPLAHCRSFFRIHNMFVCMLRSDTVNNKQNNEGDNDDDDNTTSIKWKLWRSWMEEDEEENEKDGRVLIRAFVNELLLIHAQMNDYAHSTLVLLVTVHFPYFIMKSSVHFTTCVCVCLCAIVEKWHDIALIKKNIILWKACHRIASY